jgi:hypothetical protein
MRRPRCGTVERCVGVRVMCEVRVRVMCGVRVRVMCDVGVLWVMCKGLDIRVVL